MTTLWKSKNHPISLIFYSSDETLPKNIPFSSWHQPPAIPEKKIRSSMLHFISSGADKDEVAFLPLLIDEYADIFDVFFAHLSPPSLTIHIVLSKSFDFGFFSANPLGFNEKEIQALEKVINKKPNQPPDLDKLGLEGAVVDVRKIKSSPPVFERVRILSPSESFIFLGLHNQALDLLLPAILGRFLHGLGHALVGDRVEGDEYEEVAQSWSEEIIKDIKKEANNRSSTVKPFHPRSKQSVERLCQAAIHSTFTSELDTNIDFFDLLKRIQSKLKS
ncbi:MAG: hypothetical protein ACTSYA_10485 [Candidatus Kariarchaeaceae archaeon]